MLMRCEKSALALVDLQSRLLPAMAEPERIVANGQVLLKAAQQLKVPILVSEQYPNGIGHTVPDIGAMLESGAVVEKIEFSCAANRVWRERLATLGRRQVVVAGIEAHVCVLQTAFDLVDQGYQVFVAADAVSSRDPENRAAALARLARGGVSVVTTEMVVFEWMERAGTPVFKALSKLIR